MGQETWLEFPWISLEDGIRKPGLGDWLVGTRQAGLGTTGRPQVRVLFHQVISVGHRPCWCPFPLL